MRTEDLINALAEDHAARPQPGSLRRIFFVAMALGLTIAAIAFALVLGIRPDIALAMQTWRFDFKLVMTFTLAITSARLVWQLSRPAVDPRPAEMALIIAPLLLLGAVAYELWSVPELEWLPRAIGSNSVACLLSISFLSLAPLGGAFYALRRGAPLRPGFAGAAAGLFASALAAMLYALHCPDDFSFVRRDLVFRRHSAGHSRGHVCRTQIFALVTRIKEKQTCSIPVEMHRPKAGDVVAAEVFGFRPES